MIEKITEYIKELLQSVGNRPVEVQCIAIDDQSKAEEWPTKLPFLPRIGDRVVSKSGKSLVVRAVEFSNQNKRGFSENSEVARIRVLLGREFL